MLSLIGETLEDDNDICGAVVSVRKAQDRIAIWSASAERQDLQKAIGRGFRAALVDFGKNETLKYQSHADAAASGSSFQNEVCVLSCLVCSCVEGECWLTLCLLMTCAPADCMRHKSPGCASKPFCVPQCTVETFLSCVLAFRLPNSFRVPNDCHHRLYSLSRRSQNELKPRKLDCDHSTRSAPRKVGQTRRRWP